MASYEYPAIYLRQRTDAPMIAIFSAPVGEVLKWAQVERVTEDGTGHQRIKNESRVRSIKRFLELSGKNMIPTAVTVALNIDVGNARCGECSEISINDESPGVVIDGQHRLYGIDAFDSSVDVNVTALLNADDVEIAFQFLVINNKSSKVSTDHIKLLQLNVAEGELQERLKTARMSMGKFVPSVAVVDGSQDSPFYMSVSWPIEQTDAAAGEVARTPLVRPAAIEQAIAVISNKNLPGLATDDALFEFFFTLWRVAREIWPDQWNSTSSLLQKVGLVALTTFVIDDLVPLADRGMVHLDDPEEVEREVRAILSNVDERFWSTEWTKKSLDTSAGRALVVESLATVRRNKSHGEPWNAGVELVTPQDADD